ncbi:MAG: bifunctional DNA-formamidopyrimidine glycosylase/DNA-(apurinic or apyrimidinic site) lyase [Thermoleophilia bacterium]
MPELPEVETVRRRLEPHVAGRRLTQVEVRDAKLVGRDDPRRVEERLTGRTILAIDRRGKYLLFRLDGEETLISHLRMTGNWLLCADDEPRFTRAVLTFSDSTLVAYADARRFGTWDLLTNDETAVYLAARLGPEPIASDFDGAVLKAAFAGRRAPVKALLLDQRLVAGVGNIYADEALHAACIHPDTPAGRLRQPQLDRLAATTREALEEGIRAQGASISDFRDPEGGYGSMQERFRVYGRDGEPCIVCGSEIIKSRCAGRGTHVCLTCQPKPRRSGMPRPKRTLKQV